MTFTGTRTITRTQTKGNADEMVKTITEAGGIVIWEMTARRTFCSVFVSREDAPKLVTLGWENIPGAIACFYAPMEKRWVVQGLRRAFGAEKLIFTQELC